MSSTLQFFSSPMPSNSKVSRRRPWTKFCPDNSWPGGSLLLWNIWYILIHIFGKFLKCIETKVVYLYINIYKCICPLNIYIYTCMYIYRYIISQALGWIWAKSNRLIGGSSSSHDLPIVVGGSPHLAVEEGFSFLFWQVTRSVANSDHHVKDKARMFLVFCLFPYLNPPRLYVYEYTQYYLIISILISIYGSCDAPLRSFK